MPIPGGAVASELELTLGELTNVWTLGVGSGRSLGRPKEWNGESGFRQLRIQVLELVVWDSWRGGEVPGGICEHGLADRVGNAGATRKDRGQRRGTRALVSGKALSCIRQHLAKQNRFEMWRLFHKECKPDTATRKVV